MYRCLECEREFEELESWSESRGEFWGAPCSEEMTGCPYCYSTDVEEIKDDDEEGEEDDC